ncbi:hypothetical protein ACFQ1E_06325 [Sphingomonas canadensis]|uniref:Cobalamin biosynthesis protein CobT VWA domain-containing protein n=1 Tax=Sphingomonas canadensis TaxID=1219257 RepID=A0ABW3H3P9_9SPHN|nr:hypothetical protein [Sphingomonas canadensis]MCW3835594.1 hypothetical protein [Sphingomonas canadensis]
MPTDNWEWTIGPLLVAIIAGAILWDRRRARRGQRPVERSPHSAPYRAPSYCRELDLAEEEVPARLHTADLDSEREPYRIYSRRWDLELAAEEVPARLRGASLDFERGHDDYGESRWREDQALAREWGERQPATELLIAPIRAALDSAGVAPHELSVTLLVDQSGSMDGVPIAAAAGALAVLSSALAEIGLAHEILGHSTAGWWGGFPYVHWKAHGRPPRPGRLCALLHIVYKAMDDAEWSAESQRVFVHPGIRRENIDGEALQWAAARAIRSAAPHRLLIVMSDGAAVDDATLLQNGPNYLERHLLEVIAETAASGLALGAVGINHAVGRYYDRSGQAGPEAIASVTAGLIAGLVTPP